MAVGAFAQTYNAESDFTVTKAGTAITITKFVGKGTEVNIPPTIQNTPVTRIGANAFSTNTSLASVTIPNGVVIIDQMAFQQCIMLTSVTLPSTVTNIGINAFNGCPKLTSVTFQGTIRSGGFGTTTGFPGDLRDKFFATDKTNGTPGTYTRPSGSGTTWSLTPVAATTTQNSGTTDGFKWERAGNGIKITDYSGTATAVRIPDTINNSPVTVIGNSAFSMKSITSVTIPNSVTTLEDYAFARSQRLTSVSLSTSITTIGVQAFYGCSALTTVTIPSSVTRITFGSSDIFWDNDLKAASQTAIKRVGYTGSF
jgi:hypothetical protein